MSIFGAVKSFTKKIFRPLRSPARAKEQSFLGTFKHDLQPKKVETSTPDLEVLLTRKPLPEEVYDRIIVRTKPRFVRGFWKKPELTALGLSRIKKRYIKAGYEWPRKPYKDLSRFYENARTTYFHPSKIKRLEKIAASMEKMPELIRLFEQKQEKERLDEELKKHLSESEIYQRAIGRENPEITQEKIRQSDALKLKKANEKAMKKKKKSEKLL